MKWYHFFIALPVVGAVLRAGTDPWTAPVASALQGQLPTKASFNSYPHWSPEGTTLVMESMREGNRDILVMDADGSEPVNLTNHPARDHLPAWSPDGTRIVFSSRREGNDEVYVMDRDGANAQNLTNHPGVDVMAKWSPDGTQIVFVSNRGGSFAVYTMKANGEHVKNREEEANR